MVLIGCGSAYSDLEASFKSVDSSAAPATPVKKVMFVSTKEVGISSYEKVFTVRLMPGFVELDPAFPFNIRMNAVRIPADAVGACSKTCFDAGTWDADLLIPSVGTEVSFRNAPEVIEWCWHNRVPMVNSEVQGKWLYSGAALPDRGQITEQHDSRAEFDRQAKLACQGR